MRNILFSVILLAVFLLLSVGLTPHPSAAYAQSIQAPVLKWQYGGCYASWCETGWYSSPAVADLDGDGAMEVIGAAYTLFALNGEDGSPQWTGESAGSRAWPGVVVTDLTGDGDVEVVIARGGGSVAVYNHQGKFEPG